MAATIEGTHRQLLGKFARALELAPDGTLRDELSNLKHHYMMETAESLQGYYASDVPSEEYYSIITSADYTGRIDALILNVLSVEEAAPVTSIRVHVHLEKHVEGVCCLCGKTMEVLDETSEYRCDHCNVLEKIEGMVFRDSQCYAQEGSKKRTNDYNARKHGDKWLNRIQGIEQKEIPAQTMQKMRNVMISDNIRPYQLGVELMRSIFKDPRVGATALNPHCSLVIRKLGGTPPPAVTMIEREYILSKYCTVVIIYFEVCENGKNTPYCPYFIYKIIRTFFAGNPRVLKLLNYIHLQSEDTLNKHDAEYAKICERANPGDGFVYKPTDTSEKF